MVKIEVESQTRKQNGGHCGIIYDVIIAWTTTENTEIISKILIIPNIRPGKILCASEKRNIGK